MMKSPSRSLVSVPNRVIAAPRPRRGTSRISASERRRRFAKEPDDPAQPPVLIQLAEIHSRAQDVAERAHHVPTEADQAVVRRKCTGNHERCPWPPFSEAGGMPIHRRPAV